MYIKKFNELLLENNNISEYPNSYTEKYKKRMQDLIDSVKFFNDIDDEKIEKIIDIFGYEGFNNIEDAVDDLTDKIEFYKNLPNPVTLYRVIAVKDEKMIKTDDLGEHYTPYEWAIDGDMMMSIGSENWEDDWMPFVMVVEAPLNEIDIWQTIIQNLSFPNEWEINLKNKGKGAKFIKAYKLKE